MKIGLLGTSAISQHSILLPSRNLTGIQITSVASRKEDKAERFAEKFGIPNVFADYLSLLQSPDINAVYIALPPIDHFHWARAAIENGKHVLIEKPIALNAKDAEILFELSDKKGVVLREGLHSLFTSTWQNVQHLWKTNEIGKIQTCSAVIHTSVPQRHDSFRWRQGGGALNDLAPHGLSWLAHLLGNRWKLNKVQSTGQRDVDSRTVAEFHWGGCKATVDCSIDAPERKVALTIHGTKGRAIFTNPLYPHLGHSLDIVTKTNGTRSEAVDSRNPFELQLVKFVREITTDGRSKRNPSLIVNSVMSEIRKSF